LRSLKAWTTNCRDSFGVLVRHHAVTGGQRARRLDRAETADLDHAQAANAVRRHCRVMAQLGDADIDLLRRFQYGSASAFNGWPSGNLTIDTLVNEFF
jgi:hypothetical protein